MRVSTNEYLHKSLFALQKMASRFWKPRSFIMENEQNLAIRRTFNAFEAGKILNVGHNRVRELVRCGRIKALPVGRRILISETALNDFLANADRGEQ
jgi:excisionase family DNA binding protein